VRSTRFGAFARMAIASGALLLVGAAWSGAARADVDGRQALQRERIHQGVENGSLTRPETRHLVRQQVRVERSQRRFLRNDGQLGPRERVRLHRMQDRASRHVFRAKHNARTR
jgi:hypothetical protein